MYTHTSPNDDDTSVWSLDIAENELEGATTDKEWPEPFLSRIQSWGLVHRCQNQPWEKSEHCLNIHICKGCPTRDPWGALFYDQLDRRETVAMLRAKKYFHQQRSDEALNTWEETWKEMTLLENESQSPRRKQSACGQDWLPDLHIWRAAPSGAQNIWWSSAILELKGVKCHIKVWWRKIIFQPSIFRCCVSFRESSNFLP